MSNNPQAATSLFRAQKAVAAFAMIFGALTLFSAGNVLFGSVTSQEWAGNYVGFVLWFNFLAGGVYILAAIGLWRGEIWAAMLSALIAVTTALVGVGFAFVVLRGAPFEMRTIGALVVRFSFWAGISLIAMRAFRQG